MSKYIIRIIYHHHHHIFVEGVFSKILPYTITILKELSK